MGYVVRKRTFRLKFRDYAEGYFEGLEVVARSVSIEDYLRITDLLEGANPNRDRDRYIEAMTEFVPVIVSWNAEEELEVDGVTITRPLPVTVESFLAQEEYFQGELIRAWMVGVASIPTPLRPPSQDGEQSGEEQIPMEIESSNPAS